MCVHKYISGIKLLSVTSSCGLSVGELSALLPSVVQQQSPVSSAHRPIRPVYIPYSLVVGSIMYLKKHPLMWNTTADCAEILGAAKNTPWLLLQVRLKSTVILFTRMVSSKEDSGGLADMFAWASASSAVPTNDHIQLPQPVVEVSSCLGSSAAAVTAASSNPSATS